MWHHELSAAEVELGCTAVREVGKDPLPYPDIFLRDVDNDTVGGAEVVRTFPVVADLGHGLGIDVRIEGHVRGHEQTGLHLAREIPGRIRRSMVRVHRVAPQEGWHALHA
jgi:hypothetical protein